MVIFVQLGRTAVAKDVVMLPSVESSLVGILDWINQNKDSIILLPEPLNLGYQRAIANLIQNEGATAAYFEDGTEKLIVVGEIHLGRGLLMQVDECELPLP